MSNQSLKEVQKENEIKTVFEENRTENFSELMRDNPWIQEI